MHCAGGKASVATSADLLHHHRLATHHPNIRPVFPEGGEGVIEEGVHVMGLCWPHDDDEGVAELAAATVAEWQVRTPSIEAETKTRHGR
jgi:hypothetical protein